MKVKILTDVIAVSSIIKILIKLKQDDFLNKKNTKNEKIYKIFPFYKKN
jgi:hypothetical protein